MKNKIIAFILAVILFLIPVFIVSKIKSQEKIIVSQDGIIRKQAQGVAALEQQLKNKSPLKSKVVREYAPSSGVFNLITSSYVSAPIIVKETEIQYEPPEIVTVEVPVVKEVFIETPRRKVNLLAGLNSERDVLLGAGYNFSRNFKAGLKLDIKKDVSAAGLYLSADF